MDHSSLLSNSGHSSKLGASIIGRSLPYKPTSNGQVERMNGIIAEALSPFVSSRHKDWDVHLKKSRVWNQLLDFHCHWNESLSKLSKATSLETSWTMKWEFQTLSRMIKVVQTPELNFGSSVGIESRKSPEESRQGK